MTAYVRKINKGCAEKMTKRIKNTLLVCVAAVSGAAQTQIDLRSQAKSVDFSAATYTKPSKAGTTLPASCSIGETFFKTDALAGANLYGCTATNVWSVLGGSTGATSFTQLTDLKVTRTSGTQLSIAAGVVLVGGVSYPIPAGTVGIAAGTGTVRIAIDTSVTPPTGKVYYTPGMSVTCAGLGSCTTPVAGAAFSTDDLQVATWTSTSNTFDANGSTDLRGIISRNRTLTGSGLISSTSGHTQTISVNTAVLPIFTLSPGTGLALTSGSTIAPVNRVHHVTGTSTISTITATGVIDGEILVLIPDSSFATNTSGNIALGSTAVVNRALQFVWDATAAKWYPSY